MNGQLLPPSLTGTVNAANNIIIIVIYRSSRYYYTILPTINLTVTDAHHLVSAILTVIPNPLTAEIQDYNKSVIKRHLMHTCFIQFNQLLQDVRSSLVQLSALLAGYYDTINDQQLQLLHCLLANRVPSYWDSPLHLPGDIFNLTCYIEILQKMSTLLRQHLLQNQQQPVAYDITYIPNINGLLQEFKLCYCNRNNLQAEETSLSCQVSYNNYYSLSY